MSKYTIHRKGNRARLIGDVPKSLEVELQERFMWINADDISQTVQLYADGVMYSGLAEDVRDFLREKGLEAEFEESYNYQKTYDWKRTSSYRIFQEEAVKAAIEARYCAITAGCGTGKTHMMSGIVTELGRPTTILVPQDRPFGQALEVLRNHTTIGDDLGWAGGGERNVQPCTVMIMDTLRYDMRNNPRSPVVQHFINSGVVCIDEAHKAGADSWLEAIDKLKKVDWLVALSATYQRDDSRHDLLMGVLGRAAYSISGYDAIEGKLSVPITVYVEHMPQNRFTDLDLETHSLRKKAYDRVYNDYIVNNEHRNQAAVDFMNYARETHGLTGCFSVKRIEHAKNIIKLSPTTALLHGKTDARNTVFTKLSSQEITSVASTLMDEAVDIPSLSVVAMMAGGNRDIKIKQRIRCNRVFNGITVNGPFAKERGYIYIPYDHAPFLEKHSADNIAALKKIVKEHPLNEIVIMQSKSVNDKKGSF